MELAHLTHVERLGASQWLVSCLCGWSTTEDKKADAILAGERHWQEHPV